MSDELGFTIELACIELGLRENLSLYLDTSLPPYSQGLWGEYLISIGDNHYRDEIYPTLIVVIVFTEGFSSSEIKYKLLAAAKKLKYALEKVGCEYVFTFTFNPDGFEA